jgi:hypothetical protein
MLTHSEILKEYAKCLMDPKYAIINYLRTFDKTQEGFVPFKLFKKQAEIINCFEKFRFNLITKPRQAGISTTTQAYMAIKGSFASKENPEIIVVIANKLTLAKKFLKGIKDFIAQLPRWVWGAEYYGTPEKEKKSIFIKDSQIEIILPNGTTIIAVATSVDALRGYAPTYLIFDEAAFVDNGAILYGNAITSLSTGGKAILISTPNGFDGLYYKTYEQSIKGENEYNIIEMKWYQDPRYNKDLKWLMKDQEPIEEIEFTYESYEKMIKLGYKPTSSWYVSMCKGMNNDKRRIAQELDVSFLGSGGNVIDDEDIDNQNRKYVEDPKFIDKTWFDGNSGLVKVWELPIEGHEYILAADVSRGDGSDSSAFVIIDFTTMEEVAEYQGKIQPDLFANIIKEYGIKYNAYVVVDNIGVGLTTVLKLIELGCPNMHYDKSSSNANVQLVEGDVSDPNGKVAGFCMTGVRLQLISNLEIMVRTEGIKIKSKAMTAEMKTFIYKNGRPDHMEGYHDDLLMCLGMALWVLENSFKKLKKAANQTKAMLNAWGLTSGNELQTNSVGGKLMNEYNNVPRYVTQNTQDPNNNYSWLFASMR